jgi:hypothetical protein
MKRSRAEWFHEEEFRAEWFHEEEYSFEMMNHPAQKITPDQSAPFIS